MKYVGLSHEQQVEMLRQRLVQLEGEHFLCNLNHELLVASGSNDEQTSDAIRNAAAAIEALERAHEVLLSRLEAATMAPELPAP